MSTRTVSRVNAPNTPNTEKSAQDVYARMVALEKEVRMKDSQLEQLTNEKKALEKVGKNKDTALINMTNQLLETKQMITKLEVEVARKADENKLLFDEKKGSYSLGLGNTESLRTKEIETTKDGTGILPTDLYHHVMRLENELRDRDRVVS
jgi:chromosome segregation ATPase